MLSRKPSHIFLLCLFISVATAARRSRIDVPSSPVAAALDSSSAVQQSANTATNDNLATASSAELVQVPVQAPPSPSPSPAPPAPPVAASIGTEGGAAPEPAEAIAAATPDETFTEGAENDQSSSSPSPSSSLPIETKAEEISASLEQDQNQSAVSAVAAAATAAAENTTVPLEDQLPKEKQSQQTPSLTDDAAAAVAVQDNDTQNVNNGQSYEECDPEMIGFEIITGYVFSAPNKLLHTSQVLMLTDCLEECQTNEACLAVYFETGLCVLFSANADILPGALSKLQIPTFTIYAQKTCLGLRPCARAWCVDRVLGYKLVGHAKRSINVNSRRDCLELCLGETEFTCRSANYYRATNVCELSEMDRITLAGSSAFQPQDGIDYLENNCAEEPNKLCEFKRLSGRILKTVDSVYREIDSIDECRDLCLNSPYRCHSYDFGDTGDMVCRLSHHSRATLSDIQDPYLEVPEAATYELSSCYNVTIECGAGDMVVRIRTSKLFDGKVYAKGSPKSCAFDVRSSLDFELRMGYQDLECNVHQSGSGRYMNDVVIQHHDTIVTSSDLAMAVTCQYDLTNKSVSNEVDLGVTGDIGPALSEEVIVDSPNVMMKITSRDGSDVMRSAEVGDPLALKFEILDESSPYEIFVRELVAIDGGDNAEITLIDSNGCPTDHFIMGPIYKSSFTGKILLSHFDAFKFPSSEVVQFRALVTPCMPSCEPVQCNQEDISGELKSLLSFGRRKRRSIANATASYSRRSRRETTNKPSQEDLLLVQSIQITDKFGFDKQQQTKSTGYDSNETVFISGDVSQGFCVNAIGLIVAGTIFLLAQLAVISIWTYLYQRRRKQNAYTNEGHSNSSIYGGLSGSSGSTIVTTVPNAMNTNRSESLCKLYDNGFAGRHGRQF